MFLSFFGTVIFLFILDSSFTFDAIIIIHQICFYDSSNKSSVYVLQAYSHLVTLLPLFLVRFSHLPVLPLSVLCLWAMWRRNVSRRLPSNFLCQDWRWIKKKQECFSRSAAHKKTLKAFLGLGHMHLVCYWKLMIGVTLRLCFHIEFGDMRRPRWADISPLPFYRTVEWGCS